MLASSINNESINQISISLESLAIEDKKALK